MRRFNASHSMKSAKMMSSRLNTSPSTPASFRYTRYIFLAVLFIGVFSLYHSFSSPASVEYGLMIDAGSTGSRIHTYKFSKSDGKFSVVSEDFLAIKPGLSHYKTETDDAPKSLVPLIERALSIVPEEHRAKTPVVLRATAGLRMTGENVANEILAKVRAYLRNTPFRFQDDWVSILAGNEEAIYSWLTVNYLLGREPDNTVGTIEMGGGSAQIAYVPNGPIDQAKDCDVGMDSVMYRGQKVSLYTKSDLDFGLQKARSILLKKFEEGNQLLNNPCLNVGGNISVDVPFEEPPRQMSLTGASSFQECRKMVDGALTGTQKAECNCELCSYFGKSRPKAIGEYVALAFYAERTVEIGMESEVEFKDLREKAEEVCGWNKDEVERKYPNVPNGEATDLCLDLTYMTLHLARGNGIHEGSGSKLMFLKKIGDFELGWCLGAMQQMMEQL